jgi:hypothetical protein
MNHNGNLPQDKTELERLADGELGQEPAVGAGLGQGPAVGARGPLALDRLVDGEVGQEEYAALLRSLDQTPDGWRRCALAFLEAQAWQRELGRPPVETRAPAPPIPASVQQLRKTTKTDAWPLLLAVAASFVLAFGLGLAFRSAGLWEESLDGAVPPVAERGSSLDASPEAGGMAVPETALATAVQGSSGKVTFVVDHGDGSGGREVAVPVYEWAAEHEPWLSGGPLAPSVQMRRAVQRGGHDVQMQRHFIPLETGDGRHVLIPVEQMEITPAGRRMFH